MPFHVVIITGLSGSGMSSAGKAFEDLGYFSVDNLPPQLIPTFIDLCEQAASEITRAAIVVDIRSREFLERFPEIHAALEKRGVDVRVIFLEADVDTLQRRYSETRRPHPLALPGVLAALRREREELAPIRELADEIIDTSELTIHDLRQTIRDRFQGEGGSTLAVTVTSFGFKHGAPRGLDLLFDVRFLPNPHFVAELRPLTGRDEPIIRYLEEQPEVGETLERLVDLLLFLVPRYKREGKSYLRIGIGCTGGRHRSVYLAEAIATRLAMELGQSGVDARAEHRDVQV
jgi:RNase adapter protein RapZ